MPQTQHFFIDESGNPTFYANRKRPLWEEPDFDPVLMKMKEKADNTFSFKKATPFMKK
jgi:hypothetical protein